MDARQSKRRANTSEAPPHDVARDSSTGHFRALTLYDESSDTCHAAREMVAGFLREWGLDSLVDDARLVVSELVGNVVLHAVPDDCLTRPGSARRIDVLVKTWPGWLFLGVADEDSTPPDLPVGELVSPDLVGEFLEALWPDRGRGLLITQRLADAVWWSPLEPGGKTVWCRFDLDTRT